MNMELAESLNPLVLKALNDINDIRNEREVASLALHSIWVLADARLESEPGVFVAEDNDELHYTYGGIKWSINADATEVLITIVNTHKAIQNMMESRVPYFWSGEDISAEDRQNMVKRFNDYRTGNYTYATGDNLENTLFYLQKHIEYALESDM